MVGGNFGASPHDPAEEGDFDYWVIEVSSYQATDLPCSPPVVAVTSLHPDHLDWHGGAEQYYRDKLSACSQPGAELTVANGDSDLLRERAGLLGPRVEWVSEGDDPGAAWMEPLGLPGRHNRRNALIARRCLVALGVPAAADDTRLRAAAVGYQPLPSRLTTVGTAGGVTFVDDSLSTNVLPTLAALDAFPGRRIALIVGGHDRGIDYAPLAAGVVTRDAPTYVLTLPDSGPRIRARLEAAAPPAGPLQPLPPPRAWPLFRGRDRLPGPGGRRRGRFPLGAARRCSPAVPGRPELRALQGLPRPRRSLRPRRPRAPLTSFPDRLGAAATGAFRGVTAGQFGAQVLDLEGPAWVTLAGLLGSIVPSTAPGRRCGRPGRPRPAMPHSSRHPHPSCNSRTYAKQREIYPGAFGLPGEFWGL